MPLPAVGAERMLDLRPVAYWRLGERSGTTALDATPAGLEATYHGVALGGEGAVAGDSDTAATLDGDGDSYIDLADHRIYSLARAHDDFARMSTLGWGTSAGGDAWRIHAGAPLDFTVHDGGGVMNVAQRDGVFEQGVAHVQLVDGDLQIRVAWPQVPVQGTLAASLVARRIDAATAVRAELRVHAGGDLELALVRTTNGRDEDLATTAVPGTYAAGSWWYVRFQVSDRLRAKAWPKDTTFTRAAGTCLDPATEQYACEVSQQPTTWQVEADDPSPRGGGLAVRYDTTRTPTDAAVMVASFWAQTPGITFHLWWKPTSPGLVFGGESDSRGLGTFVEVAGKGSGHGDGDDEYFFKFYSNDSNDECGVFKAYIHNLEGGHGAGARYPRDGDCRTAPDPIQPDVWHQLVVVFDSGDYLDRTAGVSLYVDGGLYLGVGEGLGTTYSGLDPLKPGYPANAAWQIVPRSANAPFRVGTRRGSSFFTGVIDELAIFSRALTASEIASLHD